MLRVHHKYEHELNLILNGTPVMIPLIIFIEEKEKQSKQEVFNDIKTLIQKDIPEELIALVFDIYDLERKHCGAKK